MERQYCYRETVSSAAAKATVNQVLSKRFVKYQQTHWTNRDAHRLVQVRTAVLSGNISARFAG